ncbi:metal-dependent hydrolase [Romboutsia maritimum]|uniref:Metal-dependent hydrolase n=1 Tax=Romboutsia maritimum TaxID=2020948 RepID=A0A371ITX0_9FIRM|nr:metal-dependent hydrolase [Romboutsia maritimum]
MTKETHAKGGYVFALIFLPLFKNILSQGNNIIYQCVLVYIYIHFSYLGSLFPDIDMKNSYISKRLPILYKFFGKKFRHRSVTHSLIFIYFLCYLFKLLIMFTDNNIVFTFIYSGFIIGYFSHMCLDLITKEGIEILYPIRINFSIFPIKTNSKSEKFLSKMLNFLVVFLIGYRFYIFL